MIIFPAIDLYEGKAVRLYKGDYAQLTVYDENPINTAKKFVAEGATHIHMVDLEGARDGNTPNFETVKQIVTSTDLFVEIGGGIRDMETIDKYLSIGVGRVILGTAAVSSEGFVERAVAKYGDKIAVGADIKDGEIAVKGWVEKSGVKSDDFFEKMQKIGVKTVICTDISRDGAMRGTNLELYKSLSEKYDMNIIASGGVSSMDDVIALRKMNVYGAIIGKAYYTGAIKLSDALRALP
ncbi:MAG: 1-(5-phosphoribosyl)-5-[(5-phosphoribosylamino)methylideneamino]imidazole-4-carboxamide isomerase [Ruminococcaceae bacterium]|nr:1-(5-phosphoribosyl)-5-[(5-phosphoribosylamino)methylideneamino]imidazole-4-carboxamide isomerase [Oscillospiraceae bacterium]